MNIYDYALGKIIGIDKSLGDLLIKRYRNSMSILKLSNDEIFRFLNQEHVKEESILKFLKGKEEFNKNRDNLTDKYMSEAFQLKEDLNIYVISLSDSNYPPQLKKIKGIPLNLYVKGNIKFDFSKSIAIVGSRNVSPYAKEKISEISKDLAKNGFCIISGLARGVDGQAHSSAVANKGKTIAVLPFLSERIYPPEHALLAKEIIRNNGALISENFSVNKTYKPYLFTDRNRIISGLSKAILIAEGAKESGSFSQYNHAKRQKKIILTLKPIKEHEGTYLPQKIISEGGFAITSVEDIISIFKEK